LAQEENERKVHIFKSVNEFDQPVWVVEVEWVTDDAIEQRYFEISNKDRAQRVFKLLISGATYSNLHQRWREGSEPFVREAAS
jgi:hypothetical protein